jgi:two-component system OmpR family response regulator
MLASMRVLVVEDEPKMAALIQRGLQRAGLIADVAQDGESGLLQARVTTYDAIVLDRMLPDIDGDEVCRRLRDADVPSPVLMLTALDGVPDRVVGLDAGADDYLGKPFSFDELLARLRALRRRGATPTPVVLRVGDLSLDPAAREVRRGDTAVTLTVKEFALLEAFMRDPGRVLTRDMLVERAWDAAMEYRSNVLEVHISQLRAKIDEPFGRRTLETVRGIGYRLCTA